MGYNMNYRQKVHTLMQVVFEIGKFNWLEEGMIYCIQSRKLNSVLAYAAL